MANRMASLFSLGKVPGWAKEIVLTCVLEGSPKTVVSAQKSFEEVSSWACTSKPITVSYLSLFIETKITVTFQQVDLYVEAAF